mgnify:CR=1 FL=1
MSIPWPQTIGAMTTGVLSIVGAANLVESSSPAPKFDPTSNRFDQGTFSGRFSKMFLACDPALLTRTEGEVQRCKELIAKSAENGHDVTRPEMKGVTDRDLWEVRRDMHMLLVPKSLCVLTCLLLLHC